MVCNFQVGDGMPGSSAFEAYDCPELSEVMQ